MDEQQTKEEVLAQLRERDPVAARIAALEKELQDLRGSRQRHVVQSIAASLLVSIAVVAVSATAQLRDMTAGTPARASDINYNFDLLYDWITRKVGDPNVAACTDARCDVAVDGSVTASDDVSAADDLAVTDDARVGDQLTIGGWMFMGGTDFWMTNAARGGGGRALVHESSDTLVLNYSGDFAGGTRIQSDVNISGDLTVAGGDLTIGSTSLRDYIRNYIRTECSVRIGWRDNCQDCGGAPERASPYVRPDGTCTDVSDGETWCNGAWGSVGFSGAMDGNEVMYVTISCN